MFWSFVSPKGGVGVSVLSAAAALSLSTSCSVTLLDLCGDQPEIFGCDSAIDGAPGVFDWLMADSSVATAALTKLMIDVRPGLRMIPSGSRPRSGEIPAPRCTSLVSAIPDSDVVIADLGVLGDDPFSPHSVICASGDRTTMVVRACYLALRRAARLPIVADDVVEVVEGGRALRTIDVEAVLHQQIDARVVVDPAIARWVDAGLPGRRLPRRLRQAVRDLAPSTSASSRP